ncbi:membrane protein [Sulfurifustis variabilis]|uniref:Membrane protein n=1 Tax=Sulfurifustis variabilis TaxID=1675686 RepID=A0A1B4VEF9_9GAMM|nr:AI-2E family transporter [Sulfurifustis variabilis]BAU49047.1 membrane protein [Sulfurifustis variabilis]
MSGVRALVILAAAAGAAVLLYLLAPILTPFLLAALLAYLFNPLVARLERWKLPRAAAVGLVFFLLVAATGVLLLFLVPMVSRQIVVFAGRVPVYLDWVQTNLVPRVEALIGEPLPVDFVQLREAIVANWQQVAKILRTALTQITASGMQVVLWLVNLVLVPIVTFYLLLDWNRIVRATLELFPPRTRPTVARLTGETDAVLSSFLRGQLLVMLALAAMYSAGLLVIGLELALPIGLLAGLVSFVPYLGFIVGLGTAGVAAYLQFQDPSLLAWVFLVFFVAQLVESYVLTPRLVGARIGLHPVAVIFAVMAGGQLFGFLGVLLGLPAAAALKVWMRHVHRSYIAPPEKPRRAPRRARQANPVP